MAQNPRFGSPEGRLLTPEERLALLENTQRLIAQLEAEHMETVRIAEMQRVAAAERAAERTQYPDASRPTQNVGPLTRDHSAGRAFPGFSATRHMSAAEMAQLRKQAMAELQAANPGIDLNSPGWSGFVNLELRRRLKLRHE